MKFHTQRFLHQPDKGTYGDCHRTCLACLLDLDPEEVPHFAELYWNDPVGWDAAIAEFLAKNGLAFVEFWYSGDQSLQSVLNTMNGANRGVYYLVSGRSKNGTNHSVVGLNDAIVHDPSLDGSGLVGPMDNGHYSITVLVPLQLTNKLKAAA